MTNDPLNPQVREGEEKVLQSAQVPLQPEQKATLHPVGDYPGAGGYSLRNCRLWRVPAGPGEKCEREG